MARKLPPFSPPPLPRYPVLDLWRGVAVVLMIGFHFCYDLVFFRVAQFNLLGNPLWLIWRATTVALFLLAMGASLHLATRRGIRWPAFLRRLGWLALCAVLVSAASLWLFPQRYIFFGILHFAVVASVLGLLFVRFDRLNLGLGLFALFLPGLARHPFFDQPALQWLGLMTHKPTTEDYVPLLPWFGVVLCGLWLGRRLAAQDGWRGVLPRFAGDAPLLWLGRHSLLVYMLHQPLLFGLFYAALAFRSAP